MRNPTDFENSENFKKSAKKSVRVEFEKFAIGTQEIADTLVELTEKGAITIIGGGDSVAAINKIGVANKVSHISTGGGASLALLKDKMLPGIAALDDM